MSLKVLLENVLRFEDGRSYSVKDAHSIAGWLAEGRSTEEVPFKPSRILMQDFTGVPGVVDLAAMRDGIIALGGDPRKVNPLVPVDLVIDPLGDGRFLRRGQFAADQCRHGIRAQRRALRVPPLGPERVQQLPRRAARHRHLPPGQPGIPGAGGVDGDGRRRRLCLPGQLLWHRQPHHHGERAGRAGLGRGRHRGRSGHAGPAHRHADPPTSSASG